MQPPACTCLSLASAADPDSDAKVSGVQRGADQGRCLMRHVEGETVLLSLCKRCRETCSVAFECTICSRVRMITALNPMSMQA